MSLQKHNDYILDLLFKTEDIPENETRILNLLMQLKPTR